MPFTDFQMTNLKTNFERKPNTNAPCVERGGLSMEWMVQV
jgi:hypothetical protein